MALNSAERQKLYRNRHKVTKPASQNAPQSAPIVTAVQSHPRNVTESNGIVTEIGSNVTPVTVLPVTIVGKFIGSPVHCLPDDYNRERYLALLPDGVRRLVLDTNNGLVNAGKENDSSDLDLRIARAVHYQEVMA
jgi:hypothetical protein